MKNILDEINSKLNTAKEKKTNLKIQKQKLLKIKHREKNPQKQSINVIIMEQLQVA